MKTILILLTVLLYQYAFADTKVNVYKPDITGLVVAASNGYCWSSAVSVARADAWRCSSGNVIYDPCFSVSGHADKVICGVNPIKKHKGFLLKLKNQLPKSSTVTVPPEDAWIIELEDGTLCYPYTGTLPFTLRKNDAIALRFGCVNQHDKSNIGLIYGSTKIGKVWRTKKAVYVGNISDSKEIKIQDVAIKSIWR